MSQGRLSKGAMRQRDQDDIATGRRTAAQVQAENSIFSSEEILAVVLKPEDPAETARWAAEFVRWRDANPLR